MFAHRYFPARYFAPRYFPDGGAAPAASSNTGWYEYGNVARKHRKRVGEEQRAFEQRIERELTRTYARLQGTPIAETADTIVVEEVTRDPETRAAVKKRLDGDINLPGLLKAVELFHVKIALLQRLSALEAFERAQNELILLLLASEA